MASRTSERGNTLGRRCWTGSSYYRLHTRHIEHEEYLSRHSHRLDKERTKCRGLETRRKVCSIDGEKDELQIIIENRIRMYVSVSVSTTFG